MTSRATTGERIFAGAVLPVLLVALALAAWGALGDHAASRCEAALGDAEHLANAGRLAAALRAIDAVDDALDCGRFTEGDEPPEHAAARAYLRRLGEREGPGAVETVLRFARGPTLRGFAGGR